MICTICKKNIQQKIPDCKHNVCDSCFTGNGGCNVCTLVDEKLEELLVSSDHYWVYSALSGSWWLYKAEYNKKINRIFDDYQKRKMNLSDDEDDNQGTMDGGVTVVIKKKKKKSANTVFSTILTGGVVPVTQAPGTASGVSHQPVNFSSFGNSSIKQEDEESDDELEDTEEEEVVEYSIMHGTTKYVIDIENMKQYNSLYPSKHRFIKRVTLDTQPTNRNELIKKFRNENIKGIDGDIFPVLNGK